jgi:hypothetical protein
MKKFVVPGTMKRRGKRRIETISLFIEADDRADARFQIHHGVIEINVEKAFPGSKVSYDSRKLRLVR